MYAKITKDHLYDGVPFLPFLWPRCAGFGRNKVFPQRDIQTALPSKAILQN
jgi:hypothetical protein